MLPVQCVSKLDARTVLTLYQIIMFPMKIARSIPNLERNIVYQTPMCFFDWLPQCLMVKFPLLMDNSISSIVGCVTPALSQSIPKSAGGYTACSNEPVCYTIFLARFWLCIYIYIYNVYIYNVYIYTQYIIIYNYIYIYIFSPYLYPLICQLCWLCIPVLAIEFPSWKHGGDRPPTRPTLQAKTALQHIVGVVEECLNVNCGWGWQGGCLCYVMLCVHIYIYIYIHNLMYIYV